MKKKIPADEVNGLKKKVKNFVMGLKKAKKKKKKKKKTGF